MFFASALTSENLRPIRRLAEKTVLLGLVTAWRLAAWPTKRSPDLVKATTDGVVRAPSAFGITTGSPPSMTDIHELVVPRSIPRILLMHLVQQWPCLYNVLVLHLALQYDRYFQNRQICANIGNMRPACPTVS